MKQTADITTYVKKFLKKRIQKPTENDNPKELMKHYNKRIISVYDVSCMTKKDILELHADIDDPAYHDHSMIIVRTK